MHRRRGPIISGAVGIAAFCAAWAQQALGAPRWSGYLAIGTGTVAALFAIALFLHQRLRRRSEDISETFRFTGDYLELGVRNGGLSMRDAGINLLVPASLGILFRVDRNRRPIEGGAQNLTTEEVKEGEPSLFWAETGMHIQGGGGSTIWYFTVGHRPGTYPARLKLYDDSTDTPRSFTAENTFTIPPLEVDPERRQRALETIVRDLDFDRQEIVRALGTGLYPSSAFAWLRHRNRHEIRSGLAWNGQDEALCAELEETFSELQRLDELRIGLGDEAPKLRGEHRAEWAVSCANYSVIRLRSREGIK
jgi:hypothetical protein